MTIEELAAESLAVYVEYNDHKIVYQSIPDYLDEMKSLNIYDDDDFTADEVAAMVEADTIWEIHWYPRSPTGFYKVCGLTLESALAKVEEVRSKDDNY